jgi:ABC-type proline/glycine betaine transport system permease subunit
MGAHGRGLVYGVGFGSFFIQHLCLLQFDLVWKAWLIILALALVIDLLLGIPQSVLARIKEVEPPPA